MRLSLGLLSDAFEATPWRALDRLVVSTTGSIAQKILAAAPRKSFRNPSCPAARLDIRTSDALADFEDGVDVAIRFGPGGWRGLQSRLLAKEGLIPVVSPQNRGGAWPRSQADSQRSHSDPAPESGWRLRLDPAEPDPMRSAGALYLADQVLVIEAAAAGHGIGLVRERLAAEDLRWSASSDPRSGGSGRI